MFRWIERKLVVKKVKLPKNADVVIGIGIDVSKDGSSASPFSRSVALKCLELYEGGIGNNILFTGGYSHAGGLTEAELMAKLIEHKAKVFIEKDSYRTFLNADYSRQLFNTINGLR